MSDEMKFKKEYQNTFNEVKAPEEFAQKMLELPKIGNKKTKTSFVKKLAAAVAILFSVFVAGNGVAYAATGSNLLEQIKQCVGELELTMLGVQIDENGEAYYEATYKGTNGTTQMKSKEGYEQLKLGEYYLVSRLRIGGTDVIEEDGKVYFTYRNIKIDITDDLEDGFASGTYEEDGFTYSYKVTELFGDWDIRVCNETYRNAEKKVPLT